MTALKSSSIVHLPRVLIFHPALAPYRIDLFNALASRFNLLIVFLHDNVPYQKYDQSKLKSMLHADHMVMTEGFNLLGRAIRTGAGRIVKSFKPDVIVTHEFSPTTLQIMINKTFNRIPQIVWTADTPQVIAAESFCRRLSRKVVLPSIEGMIVYSPEVKQYYRSKFGFNGVIGICPNAQSENEHRSKLLSALQCSFKLALQHNLQGKRILLFVGRLAKVKRLERLITAFASVVGQCPDTLLVLVGEGHERVMLEQMATQTGVASSIIFVGHCEGDDLYAWFNLGSLFVLVSESETWGAVINEALISGMPAICTDQAGAKILISENMNGDVIDAGDETALQRSLLKWLKKVPLLDMDNLTKLRPSLMTHSFDTAVDGFASAIFGVLPNRQNSPT